MHTHDVLTDIERDHGSPFYLFDREAFLRNLRDIRAAFLRQYPSVILGYSYKTNYLPYLCRLAKAEGAYAEVVSRLELDLALRIGCKPTEIIFNGPLKTEDDIDLALREGIHVNLDTFRELEQVVVYALRHPEHQLQVGLRINVPLVDDDGKSHLQAGLPTGRFGFAEESLAEVVAVIAKVPNLEIHALHGHTSSSTRSLWVYRTIARRLAEVAERYFPDSIDFLNVGGGFFGRPAPAMGLADVPTYEDYAAAIGEELQRHPWVMANQPTLIIEPGMAVVADTLSFFTRVFEVKQIADRHLAVIDGTIFNVKPTFHSRNHPFALIRPDGRRGQARRYDVVGSTCMEKDCLLQGVECQELERGDFIRIDNVGAYTIVLSPPFIQTAPPVLVREAEGFVAIRRRQEFSDVFATYLL